jgi:integrase
MQKLYADIESGEYNFQKAPPTVADAFALWLEDRSGEIKSFTAKGYQSARPYIVGPLLIGSKEDRQQYTLTGKVPKGCRLMPMLGQNLVSELTPADIRSWHRTLCDEVGAYTANKCMQRLKTMLAMIAEDYNIRPPVMPQRIGNAFTPAQRNFSVARLATRAQAAVA